MVESRSLATQGGSTGLVRNRLEDLQELMAGAAPATRHVE